MKRKYRILLRASFIAIVLFGAWSPIGWFGKRVSVSLCKRTRFRLMLSLA
jgi:hypothetical protein